MTNFKKGQVVMVTGLDNEIEHHAEVGSSGIILDTDYPYIFGAFGEGYHIVAFTDGQVFPNGQGIQMISEDNLEVVDEVPLSEVKALALSTGYIESEEDANKEYGE